MTGNITIEKAGLADLEEILRIQHEAFQEEARIYNCCAIPPLTQTLEDLKNELAEKTFLKAVTNGHIVGSVRAGFDGKTVLVEKLAVAPSMQNRGIASRLLTAVENLFPAAIRYELFTGRLSGKNLYLYHKLGYREFKRHNVGAIELVYLEKVTGFPGRCINSFRDKGHRFHGLLPMLLG